MPEPGHDEHGAAAAAEDHAAEPTNARANVAALLFVALLFLGAYWVFEQLRHERDMQNCIDSGRRNCIELNAAAKP